MNTHTDCRTEEGITVGLIDSIITLARVLRTRKFKTSAIQQSLIDLRSDEDVTWLTREKVNYAKINGKNLAETITTQFKNKWKEKIPTQNISHDTLTDT